MHGSRGSALTVVPFNQGSKQDVDALVDYIYSTLNLDLVYVLPFAAIPKNGREIDGLDDKSELAHRVMLVDLLRLLGAIKQKAVVISSLKLFSRFPPIFGNGGLYLESKISLQQLKFSEQCLPSKTSVIQRVPCARFEDVVIAPPDEVPGKCPYGAR
jgi:fatty acid synthase subunit alpha, fungi type